MEWMRPVSARRALQAWQQALVTVMRSAKTRLESQTSLRCGRDVGGNQRLGGVALRADGAEDPAGERCAMRATRFFSRQTPVPSVASPDPPGSATPAPPAGLHPASRPDRAASAHVIPSGALAIAIIRGEARPSFSRLARSRNSPGERSSRRPSGRPMLPTTPGPSMGEFCEMLAQPEGRPGHTKDFARLS